MNIILPEGKDLASMGPYVTPFLEDRSENTIDFTDKAEFSALSMMAYKLESARVDAQFHSGSISVVTKADNGLVPVEKAKPNDDGFLIGSTPDGKDYIVIFDGVSSGGAGYLATKIAAETIDAELQAGSTMLEAFKAANQAVYEAQHRTSNYFTTVAMGLLIDGDKGELVNVGDCDAQQSDTDGEIVEDIIPQNTPGVRFSMGKITKEKFWGHKLRNVVEDSLGTFEKAEHFEVVELDFKKGDRFYMRTDGLCDMRAGLQVVDDTQKDETPEDAVDTILHTQDQLSNQAQSGRRPVIRDQEDDGTEFTVEVKAKKDNMTAAVYEHGASLRDFAEILAGREGTQAEITGATREDDDGIDQLAAK